MSTLGTWGQQCGDCGAVLASSSQTRRCQLMPHTPASKQHGEPERWSCCGYRTKQKKNGCAQAPERGFLNRQWERPKASGDWLTESLFRRQAPSARRQVETRHLPPGLRPLRARFSPAPPPPAAGSPLRPWTHTKDALVPRPPAPDFVPQPTT